MEAERKRAATVTEPKYDGSGTRKRCTECDKIAKESRAVALEAADRIFNDRGVRMRPYFNRHCGWWHLTSNQGKRNGNG